MSGDGQFTAEGQQCSFEAGFDTSSGKSSLTEASPLQYRFDVPHVVNGLD